MIMLHRLILLAVICTFPFFIPTETFGCMNVFSPDSISRELLPKDLRQDGRPLSVVGDQVSNSNELLELENALGAAGKEFPRASQKKKWSRKKIPPYFKWYNLTKKHNEQALPHGKISREFVIRFLKKKDEVQFEDTTKLTEIHMQMGMLGEVVTIRLKHTIFRYVLKEYLGEFLELEYLRTKPEDEAPQTVASFYLTNHRLIERVSASVSDVKDSDLQSLMYGISKEILKDPRRQALKGSEHEVATQDGLRSFAIEALRFSFPSLEGVLY